MVMTIGIETGESTLEARVQSKNNQFKIIVVAVANDHSAAASLFKLLRNVAAGCVHAVNIACFFHLFKENVGSLCLTDGPSMLPTFEISGEIAIESTVSHQLAPYNLTRGELVSLKSPVKSNRIICKRIIGLPGDIVCIDPTGLKAPSGEHVIVPKGHVWIAGDNAACSTDSRDYGPVSMGLIRGRIVARVFPFNRFEIFTRGGTRIDERDIG